MTAIAWAIVCASIYMMHPRDKKDDGFEFNNRCDFILFVVALGMLIYFSFKS